MFLHFRFSVQVFRRAVQLIAACKADVTDRRLLQNLHRKAKMQEHLKASYIVGQKYLTLSGTWY